MKKLILSVVASLAVIAAHAGELNWMTSLPEAQAKAKTENKLVMMDFTGSDWCGWCIKLNKEIFSTPEFAAYAAKNLVLVELDFPRKKPQSDELKAANKALAKKYGIRGYPTIIVLDSAGKQVGELGYMKGGPEAFIAELDKLKGK
jgi:protein disulfide-isomerase